MPGFLLLFWSTVSFHWWGCHERWNLSSRIFGGNGILNQMVEKRMQRNGWVPACVGPGNSSRVRQLVPSCRDRLSLEDREVVVRGGGKPIHAGTAHSWSWARWERPCFSNPSSVGWVSLRSWREITPPHNTHHISSHNATLKPYQVLQCVFVIKK